MDESVKLSNSFHPADIKGMGGHWKLWTVTLTCIVHFKKYCQLFILIRFICERPGLTVVDNDFNGTIFIADLEWTVMDHHKEMPRCLVFSLTNIPTSVIILGKVCINFKRKPCLKWHSWQHYSMIFITHSFQWQYLLWISNTQIWYI